MTVSKKTILVVLSAFLAINVQASSFKKYAGEFLYLGVGARATALGGAYAALANDVTATYWNPAGLISAQGTQFLFMHSKEYISSIQNNYIGVSNPLTDHSVLGISLYYLTVNDIPNSVDAYNEAEQKVDYSKVTRFNTGDYVFSLAYANRYNEELNWGVSVKFIYRDYQVKTATGLGFDAGAQYKWNGLKLGLVLRDVTGTLMAWSTGTKELVTPSGKFGIAYDFTIPAINLVITPTADVNALLENREYATQWHLGPLSADGMAGLETVYDGLLAVRVGIDDVQRFTAGVGINIPKVSVDYSFTGYESELGNIHRISFHVLLDKLF